MSKITIKNSCAIIVTYNPDDAFLERIQCINHQFGAIIIVDNGSKNAGVESVSSQFSSLVLIKNAKNEGIAKALNIGISKAMALGFEWFVTFDQDTVINDNFFSVHQKIQNEIDFSKCIVGSNYWNNNKNSTFLQCPNLEKRYSERKTVITSGMVFSKKAFEEIGCFVDEFFIDSVDHEFCIRARGLGYNVLISCDEVMSHSIGEQHHSRALNWLPLAYNHSAFRKYFMARNTLATVKQYFRQEPVWCLCQLVRLGVEFISIFISEKDKKEKMNSFMRGAKDAWAFEWR